MSNQLISPEHSLQHAISVTRKTKLIRAIILHSNPFLFDLTLGLAEIITHEYPDMDEGMLLSNCITGAANAFAEDAEKGGRMEDSEYEFVNALILHASRLVEICVHGIRDDANKRWRPFTSGLQSWSDNNKLRKIVFARQIATEHAREAARILLIGRLIPYEKTKLITRLAHQEIRSEYVD